MRAEYVTRAEFDAFVAEMRAIVLRRRVTNEDVQAFLAELAYLLDGGDFTAESAAVRINLDPNLRELAEAAGAKPPDANADAYSVGVFLRNRDGTIVGQWELKRLNGEDRPALWGFR